MKQQKPFFRNKQGRIRCTIKPPEAFGYKQGRFITKDNRVIFIGGPGAGGGSVTTQTLEQKFPKLYAQDPFGKPVEIATPEDLQLVHTAVLNVIKTTDYDMTDTLLAPTRTYTHADVPGFSTTVKRGDDRGTLVNYICTGAIDKSIATHGLKAMLSWNGLPVDGSRKDLLMVIVAHEIGHSWFKQHPEVQSRWEQSRFKYVSDYAQSYYSSAENFACAFALFTQGYALPSEIEDFLLEVTQ